MNKTKERNAVPQSKQLSLNDTMTGYNKILACTRRDNCNCDFKIKARAENYQNEKNAVHVNI